jgi:hypothetical protein
MPSTCPATHPALINGLCFPSANPCAPGALQFYLGNAPFCTFFSCPAGFTFYFISYPGGILGYCSLGGPLASTGYQLVLDSAPCPPSPPPLQGEHLPLSTANAADCKHGLHCRGRRS